MSSKDSYYFSHDSNAKNDEKIVRLRMKHGWEGYGLYWAIIERLRESSNYMSVCDFNLIAYDLRTDSAKIKSIVEDFGLFAFTDESECFYSESLTKRMELKNERSTTARKNAQKRWDKCDSNATAMQQQCKPNAIKESKVKESKEKDIITPVGSKPKSFKSISEEEFKYSLIEFVDEFGKQTVRSFFEYWSEKDSKGKMRFQLQQTWDSKKRLTTWKNNESKFGNSTPVKSIPKPIPGPWN